MRESGAGVRQEGLQPGQGCSYVPEACCRLPSQCVGSCCSSVTRREAEFSLPGLGRLTRAQPCHYQQRKSIFPNRASRVLLARGARMKSWNLKESALWGLLKWRVHGCSFQSRIPRHVGFLQENGVSSSVSCADRVCSQALPWQPVFVPLELDCWLLAAACILAAACFTSWPFLFNSFLTVIVMLKQKACYLTSWALPAAWAPWQNSTALLPATPLLAEDFGSLFSIPLLWRMMPCNNFVSHRNISKRTGTFKPFSLRP